MSMTPLLTTIVSDDLLDLIGIVRVVGFVVHDQFVIHKVEAVRLGAIRIVDHFSA